MNRGPQTDTRLVTLTSIMRSRAFRAGVADMRAERPARFDDFRGFEHERGRQWAIRATRTMSLFIGRRLNPGAHLLHIGEDIR